MVTIPYNLLAEYCSHLRSYAPGMCQYLFIVLEMSFSFALFLQRWRRHGYLGAYVFYVLLHFYFCVVSASRTSVLGLMLLFPV